MCAIWAIFSHFWAVSREHPGFRGEQRVLCHKGIEAHVHGTDRFPSFVRFDLVSEAFWAKKKMFWGTKCVVL